MKKFQSLLMILIAALCLSSCSSKSAPTESGDADGGGAAAPVAREGRGSGNAEGRERAMARTQQMMDDLRAKKKTKNEVLASMRERMEKRGGEGIDERLTKVGAVLDRVIAADDASYTQKKEDFAKQVMQAQRRPK